MSTATKEKPILFSGEMVKAILAGRKTQTRRVIKEVPTFLHLDRPIMDWGLSGVYQDDDHRFWLDVQTHVDDNSHSEIFCPYGEPGDRLYVRETVCLLDRDHWADSHLPRDAMTNYGTPRRNGCAYKAECGSDSDRIRREYGYKWTPSILAPRWTSRITLEITGVRVERLQDISEADAQREGVERPVLSPETMPGVPPPFNRVHPMTGPYRDGFKDLWGRINGPGSWEANPWVWVIEFKRLETTV